MPPIENGNDEHDVSQTSSNAVESEPLGQGCDGDGVNGDHFSDEGNPILSRGSFDVSSEEESTSPQNALGPALLWEPSGNRWKDMLYFVGPGESRKKEKSPKCVSVFPPFRSF